MLALAARDPLLGVSTMALLRQPLAWAALAAFLGSAVGLAGIPSPALWVATSGGLLAPLSLLGIASLLGRGSWVTRVGVALLLVWLVASLSFVLYSSLWQPGPSATPPFPVLLHASLWGGSAAVLPFAIGALFEARRRRLGAVLLVLSVPGALLVLLYANSIGAESISLGEIVALVGPFSLPGAGVGLPEAVLWVSLGVLLLGEARQRALGDLRRKAAEENRLKALRLYEEGLGGGDRSAVEEVVSEDFRDLASGARGKQGMGRIVSDMWASYPDLCVSVEGQETEGDLVRTRLRISGTDRGRGVMWYPPTGRRVSFGAEFVDRFSGGLLVEHVGEADTEGLLRQLGYHQDG
jgi:predicted ester cyclase